MNKKQIISMIIGAVIAAVSYQVVSRVIFSPPSIDSQLIKVANEVNKNCPFMVDQYTRFDNTIAGPGKSLAYNYTVVNYEATELNIESIKEYITPILINMVKTSEEMKSLREIKVSLKYNYRDKSGVFLFSVLINPEDYES
jgi:hypothetical protein